MKIFLLYCAVLSVTIGLGGCSSIGADGSAAEGRVVYFDDGSAAPGVRVKAWTQTDIKEEKSQAVRDAISGSDGTFRFKALLPDKEYLVGAEDSKFSALGLLRMTAPQKGTKEIGALTVAPLLAETGAALLPSHGASLQPLTFRAVTLSFAEVPSLAINANGSSERFYVVPLHEDAANAAMVRVPHHGVLLTRGIDNLTEFVPLKFISQPERVWIVGVYRAVSSGYGDSLQYVPIRGLDETASHAIGVPGLSVSQDHRMFIADTDGRPKDLNEYLKYRTSPVQPIFYGGAEIHAMVLDLAHVAPGTYLAFAKGKAFTSDAVLLQVTD